MKPLDVALEIANEASEMMLYWFDKSPKVLVKADESPVTQADIEINAMAVERIGKAFPDHGFIGEEQSGESTAGEYVWLCDPIDGTRPFTAGIPVSTFTLALVQDGQPILGIVRWPFRDWTFAAELGKGATLNGEPISVGNILANRQIEVSNTRRAAHYTPHLEDELDARGFVSSWNHSTALFASFIACGRLSGMTWGSNSPWDVAAAKVIIEEAGGIATDLYGNEQRYDTQIKGFLAADSAATHAELLSAITAARR